MTNILFYSPGIFAGKGHNKIYAEKLYQFLSSKYDISFFTSKPEQNEQIKIPGHSIIFSKLQVGLKLTKQFYTKYGKFDSIFYGINRFIVNLRLLTEYLKWISKKDVDILHFLEIEYFAFFFILPFIKLVKKPVIVLIHTGNFNYFSNNPILGLYKFLSKFLVKSIVKNVSIITVHSDVIKKSLIESLNIKGNVIHKIHVTNYGTESILLMPTRQESLTLLGLNHIKKKIILFFGNVRRDKGIMELIRLIDRNKVDNYILLIAGKLTGISKNEFYESIHNISNIIFHEGFIDDDKIKHYYNVAEYLILPYHNYFMSASGPLTLSLTYRTPIICSQSRHIKNFVEKYNIGLSFDLYDENSFRAIIKCAFEKDKKDFYNNFDKAIIGNTWQDMVNSIIQVYNTLL